MKTRIPKVRFKIAKLKDIIPLINFFLNPKEGGWDWSHYILNKYPELKKKLSNVKNKERRKKITQTFFEKQQKKEIENLNKAKERYQKTWERINDDVMITLSEIVEQKWPKNLDKITARISLCPINPRHIKSRTFDIYYKSSIHDSKATNIHEILHFIYFEKWKKLFPKIPEKKFDAPYLVWDLSEMATSIILSDKRIQKIFKHKPHPYKEHEKIKINEKYLLTYLREFYKKRKNFDNFLRDSWKFLNKNNNIIKGKI